MAGEDENTELRLNHVALAVPDIEAAAGRFAGVFGVSLPPPREIPEHGVTVVFMELSNSLIEIMQPLGFNSPIASFLRKHPRGGIHHVCLGTSRMATVAERIKNLGIRLSAGGTGARGDAVIFLHPGDMFGTLFELEQTEKQASSFSQTDGLG